MIHNGRHKGRPSGAPLSVVDGQWRQRLPPVPPPEPFPPLFPPLRKPSGKENVGFGLGLSGLPLSPPSPWSSSPSSSSSSSWCLDGGLGSTTSLKLSTGLPSRAPLT